jgi:hypothetical protein
MPAMSDAQNNAMPMPSPAHPRQPILWSYQNIIVFASKLTPSCLSRHKTCQSGAGGTSVRDLRPSILRWRSGARDLSPWSK